MKDIEIGPIRPPSESNSLLIRVTRGCHGSILRSLEKACYINGFHRSDGAYYTTITPFVEEL